MLWKSDDEVTQLKNKVAELEKKIGDCHCDPSSSNQAKPSGRLDYEQFMKEIEEKKREDESEARYQREQERSERLERIRNRNSYSSLERPDLYEFDEEDTRSKSHRNTGEITIDWRGIPVIIGVMVLAWIWFNRPVEPNSRRYPSSAQQIQVQPQ